MLSSVKWHSSLCLLKLCIRHNAAFATVTATTDAAGMNPYNSHKSAALDSRTNETNSFRLSINSDNINMRYNNIFTLINGIYTGSLKNASPFYLKILEWTREARFVVTDEKLSSQSDNIMSNKTSEVYKLTYISDLQLSMLILAGSKLHGNASIRRRLIYLSGLMDELRRMNLLIGIESINALLRAALDNETGVDASYFLRTLMKHSMDPNFETFELLSRVYALNANPKAILELMTLINKERGHLSVTLFQNLAYGEVILNSSNEKLLFSSKSTLKANLDLVNASTDDYTEEDVRIQKNLTLSSSYKNPASFVHNSKYHCDNNDKLAKIHRTVELFKQMCGPLDGRTVITRPIAIYLNAALAFAQVADLDGVVQTLDYVTNTFFDGERKRLFDNWNVQIIEIYLLLLAKNVECEIVFEKMKPFLRLETGRRSKFVIGKYSDFQILNYISKFRETQHFKALFHVNKLIDDHFNILHRSQTSNLNRH